MTTRTTPIAPIFRAGFWIMGSGVFFALTAVIVRHLSGSLHPFEISFFRNLFGLIVMAIWLYSVGPFNIRVTRPGLMLARGLTATGAQLCWFTAVTLMPIADATALNFTMPLFGTMGAALFLGEKVGPRRISAVVIGFLGAMIVLKPGFETIQLASILVLGASAFQAIAQLLMKVFARTDSPNVIVFYLSAVMTPTTGIAAFFVWQEPSFIDLLWLAVIGVTQTIGQQCLVRGFAIADAAAVMPWVFTRLIFAAVLGLVLFQEIPEFTTWIGAAVIFSANIYTARREASLRKPARENPPDGAVS